MLVRSVLCTLVALLPETPKNTLWVVDSSGAGDFVEIVDAVAAASEGDTILVHAGFDAGGYPYSYLPIEIVDKELTIVAECGEEHPEPAQVRGIAVRDLARGKRLVVDGLDVGRTPGEPSIGVRIENCLGTVHLACELILGDADGSGPGVLIVDSRDVTFLDVAIHTGNSDYDGPLAPAGVEVVDSQLGLYRCRLVGGGGDWGSENKAGPGLFALDSLVYCVRSEIQGGYGGDGYYCSKDQFGEGGDGVVLEGSSRLVLVETSIEGGWGGTNFDFGCSEYGEWGEALVVGPDAEVETREEEPRELWVTPLAREHGKVRVVATGSPGDHLSLVRSKATGFTYSEEHHGVVHVEPGPGYQVVELGTLGFDGLFDMEFDVGHLGPAWPGDVFALQVFASRSSGAVAASTPQFLTVIDGGTVHPCEGLRLYVDLDAPSGGDGRSWETASNDLQATVDQANDLTTHNDPGFPVQVWVAEGVYRGFVKFRSEVELYGGFVGDETDLSERDPLQNATVLSGDLNGDDLPDFVNVSDNLPTVVKIYVAPTEPPALPAVLDGFHVEGAHNGAYSGNGGAIRLEETFARIRNCVVRNNWTDKYGAGITMPWNGAPQSRVEVTDCRFEGNVAELGGAIRAAAGSGKPWIHVHVSRCTFEGNVALQDGGAIHASGSVTVSDCRFNGNEAQRGGGLFADMSAVTTRVRGCTFHANSAATAGGGLFLSRVGPPVLLRPVPTVSDTILWGNLTAGLGGETGQLDWDQARPRMIFSCVEGWTGTLEGRGSHGLDPLFVDPLGPDGVAGTSDDDLHLGAGSPCVDSGSNAEGGLDGDDVDGDGSRSDPASIDLEGRTRRLDDPAAPDQGEGEAPVIDRGAYEREG